VVRSLLNFLLPALVCALFFSQRATADTASRLAGLISVPGVAGYEASVREAVEMLLPIGARVRADNLGNITIRTGNGPPHTLIVAPLDESGFVASAVTDDGYLRVHRHTTAPATRLITRYYVGQPIVVRTRGGMVDGVTATPSTHFCAFPDAADDLRINTLDDTWVDVGAGSRADVEKLGIRLLDSITLRDRGLQRAATRVSGVAAGNRAAALALAEVVRGTRGLLRLRELASPDRVIVLSGAPGVREHPRGAVGVLGTGPMVRMDLRDLDALVKLIVALAKNY
jgi:putative aminopeptidase FrvX